MKKIFSLFAAVLFAGSLMAAEKTVTYVFTAADWKATVNDEAANWSSDKNGAGFNNGGVQVTTAYSGAGATSPDTYNEISKIVITYNTNKSAGAGTFDVKIGENDKVSKEWAFSGSSDGRSANFTTVFDYATAQSGAVKLTVNTTTNSAYVVSIAITYTEDASAPSLKANKIDLGIIPISEEETKYEKDTLVEVIAANLAAPIAVANSAHVTATEASLPVEGGTLHLHINAPVGELKDTIVLTSGELVVKVPVVGTIKQTVILPGTPVAIVGVSGASDAKVDGVAAIKAGTGSAGGSVKVTVPANTIKLHFLAVAWNGEGGDLAVSAPDGVTVTPAAVEIVADEGISGSGTDYTLKNVAMKDCAHVVELANIVSDTEITISRSAAKNRFVIWGATYETSGGETAVDNTNADVKAVKFFENGQLVIIKNGVKYNATGAIIK